MNWNLTSANNYYFKVENLNTGYVYYSNALSSGVNSITIGTLTFNSLSLGSCVHCVAAHIQHGVHTISLQLLLQEWVGNSNEGLNITPLTTQMPSEFEENPFALNRMTISVTFSQIRNFICSV